VLGQGPWFDIESLPGSPTYISFLSVARTNPISARAYLILIQPSTQGLIISTDDTVPASCGCLRYGGTWRNAIALLTAISIGNRSRGYIISSATSGKEDDKRKEYSN
jgi:hypothetical protein